MDDLEIFRKLAQCEDKEQMQRVIQEYNESQKVKTNADRIRAMSDEGLAVALANSMIDVLLMAHDMSGEQEKVPKYLRDSLTQNYLKWLREPAEGE